MQVQGTGAAPDPRVGLQPTTHPLCSEAPPYRSNPQLWSAPCFRLRLRTAPTFVSGSLKRCACRLQRRPPRQLTTRFRGSWGKGENIRLNRDKFGQRNSLRIKGKRIQCCCIRTRRWHLLARGEPRGARAPSSLAAHAPAPARAPRPAAAAPRASLRRGARPQGSPLFRSV